LDYPQDWSVSEAPDGAIFTRLQGTTIRLQIAAANAGKEKTASQPCVTLVNRRTFVEDAHVMTSRRVPLQRPNTTFICE
jgi:hypothetical protein